MSAGAFTLSKYETDTGEIVNIKVQPETLLANLGGVNAAAAGTLSAGFPSAQVGKSKRAIGINARTVSIRLTAALTGYKPDSILRIPILTSTIFDGLSRGTTGTYLGTACVVVGKSPEKLV